MTPLRLLWYCLWVTPHALQGIILLVMVRRGLNRQFPMFFLYTVFEVLQFVVLFAISQSHLQFGEAYKHVYSVGLALSTAVRFSVIHELFGHFFRRYPTLDGARRLLFRGTIVVMLLVAVGLAVSAPGNGADFFVRITYVLARTVSVLQCGLLISLFWFSKYFVLSWRSHAFGIALGLGILASVELATSAIWLHLGAFGNIAVNLFTMATYNCCVLIWIFYLTAEDRRPQYPTNRSPKLPKYDLEIWNQELERLLHQ
jgi:hypothetical protein